MACSGTLLLTSPPFRPVQQVPGVAGWLNDHGAEQAGVLTRQLLTKESRCLGQGALATV